MKKIILAATAMIMLSGCVQKIQPVCEGVVSIGGQDVTVQIYGVKKDGPRTQYRPGYPFDFRWTSAINFKSTTCKKPA